MNATIAKWGNSLAVRVPKHIADELGLAAGTPVELRVEDGRLVLAKPRPKLPRYKLSELLEGYDGTNNHPEVDWGPDVGREIID
jgi:antitoxin MazE